MHRHAAASTPDTASREQPASHCTCSTSSVEMQRGSSGPTSPGCLQDRQARAPAGSWVPANEQPRTQPQACSLLMRQQEDHVQQPSKQMAGRGAGAAGAVECMHPPIGQGLEGLKVCLWVGEEGVPRQVQPYVPVMVVVPLLQPVSSSSGNPQRVPDTACWGHGQGTQACGQVLLPQAACPSCPCPRPGGPSPGRQRRPPRSHTCPGGPRLRACGWHPPRLAPPGVATQAQHRLHPLVVGSPSAMRG